MKKWTAIVLILMLFITVGVKQAQCPIQTQNKNTVQCVTNINNKNYTKCVTNDKQNNNYMIMEATAYTKSIAEGTHKGITRSGTQVSRGTIAVDPRVIPLGTKVYVEGYGHAECLDTGGAIKGNRIDLYMDSREECFEFGRREVKVWIID